MCAPHRVLTRPDVATTTPAGGARATSQPTRSALSRPRNLPETPDPNHLLPCDQPLRGVRLVDQVGVRIAGRCDRCAEIAVQRVITDSEHARRLALVAAAPIEHETCVS